jgi:hypothetical protein
MLTILRARLLRAYSLALVSLGAAAYISGGVTADICSAYEMRRVVGANVPAAGAPSLDAPALC